MDGNNSNDEKKKKTNKLKKKKNLIEKKKRKQLEKDIFRVVNIIIFLILIIFLPYSVWYYFSKDIYNNYLLMGFEFFPDYYYPLTTSPISFLMLLSLLEISLILNVNSLIRNESKEINLLVQRTSIFFMLSLICIGITAAVPLFSLRTYETIRGNIFLGGLGVACISIVLIKIRKYTYNNVIHLINELFTSSIILSILVYILSFNVIELITRTEHNLTLVTVLKQNMTITGNVFMICFGIVILGIYKDIVLPFCLVIIETGFLMRVNLFCFSETLTSIIGILFLFYSVVLMIFKNKLAMFRYKIVVPNSASDSEEKDDFTHTKLESYVSQ